MQPPSSTAKAAAPTRAPIFTTMRLPLHRVRFAHLRAAAQRNGIYAASVSRCGGARGETPNVVHPFFRGSSYCGRGDFEAHGETGAVTDRVRHTRWRRLVREKPDESEAVFVAAS